MKHFLLTLIDYYQLTVAYKINLHSYLPLDLSQVMVKQYYYIWPMMVHSVFIMQPFYTLDIFKSFHLCLLYTSDAADEGLGVDLGGRRIIKKKNF